MQATIDRYHEKVLDIWERGQSSDFEAFQRWPLLSPPPACEKVEVVTLGFNPSYVREELKSHWHHLRTIDETMPEWTEEALGWKPAKLADHRASRIDMIKRLDKYSRETYQSYYEPIRELVAAAGQEEAWYHMDAFPLRETDARQLMVRTPIPANDRERQRYAEAALDSPLHNTYRWNQAFSDLLQASIELILALHPKVVVVLNSHVSRILHHKLPLRLQANGHRYESENVRGTVFLLGSQLSGGATSTYAKERLLADLRDVVRGKNGLDGGEAGSSV